MGAKKINLLASDEIVGSSLVGVIDVIQFANLFWRFLHPNSTELALEYTVYAANGSQIQFSNGLNMDALPLAEYQPADAVFLMSGLAYDKASLETYLSSCSRFNDVLSDAAADNQLVVGYCSGTFGLAASGVLDNKQATTVWWLSNLFQNLYPSTRLNLDELVIMDENIITGGATTSYFNVCLRLIEQLVNEIFALRLSKFLLLDRHRLSQRPFMDSGYIVNKQDKLVEQVQDWMMSHYAMPVSLDKLCDEFAVTKRTLIRRFKASCSETPLNYLQRIRVEKAKYYLETTSLPVERIVEKVGYEDAASFRKLFSSQTQLTPKAYRERFTFIAKDESDCCRF